LRQLILVVIDL